MKLDVEHLAFFALGVVLGVAVGHMVLKKRVAAA